MPPLALLAGGLATRLGPEARHTPKSLFKVAGEAFISHQLRLFRSQGIREVVVCAGHLGAQIESFVGNGNDFGIAVSYSFDGDTLLGTGGAIKKALPLLGDTFFVMYGDSYLDIPFELVLSAHSAGRMPALMTVYNNKDRWDRSNTAFSNGRVVRHDKNDRTPDMHYIDYGLGILTPKAFEYWKNTQTFDLSELYGQLAQKGLLAGYEATRRFYEIGSLSGLAELERRFLSLK